MNNEKKEYNYRLQIPILEGYQIVDIPTRALFIARSNDNSTEQYIEEGRLKVDETFNERLENIIKTTENLFEKNNYQKQPLSFIKEYETDKLKFQLYMQDNIRDNTVIRQINAYFLEPQTNYLYQIVLSAPELNIEDLNDNVTKRIYYKLTTILDNIKYNEQYKQKEESI